MNLPNRLTVLRMILSIPFIAILITAISLGGNFSYKEINSKTILFIVSGLIFIIAMITDYFDGYLARKNKQITTFGKLFDPLADKIMTTSALIILSVGEIVPIWITVIFVIRDIIVDGSRNLAAANNKKIEASIWGKLKTMIMSIAIILIFLLLPVKNYKSEDIIILNIPLIIGAILSIISGYKYFINIIPILKHK